MGKQKIIDKAMISCNGPDKYSGGIFPSNLKTKAKKTEKAIKIISVTRKNRVRVFAVFLKNENII